MPRPSSAAPLAPLALPVEGAGPNAGEAWSAWLDERARGALRTAGTQVAALKETAEGAGEDAVAMEIWNDIAIELGNAFAVSSLLSSVHPEPAVVELAEQIELEAQAFTTDLHLDPQVYARLDAVDRDALDEGGRRVLDLALRDFRRSGVDRGDEVRERVRALDARMTELDQTFARHIRDGRRETRVPASALQGLPEDYVAEHHVEEGAVDGLVSISTDYPDTHPFLERSHDADARRAVAATFYDLGWPDNDGVLGELLAARHEKATLLGYDDWPSYDAEVKMIGSGPAIGEFVDRIAAESEAAGRRDLAVLAERAAADGVEAIDVSSSRYYLDTVSRERFGVDGAEVRRYFDFAKVKDGLLAVTGRLFGLSYVPVDQAEARTWHADVSTYDVVLDGQHLGRIHLDLHPRKGKYNHAAQFDLVPGVLGRQLPEGVLVCNFPRGLMDHRDVVTLFHEFGHLMHHVLAGRHPWVRFSGVATEWDFVEAPSQMLEEWAWDADVLRTFATDAEGTPIPEELVAHMVEAEEFGKGLHARTQMTYAAISYRFHLERPADLTARLFELYDEYSLIAPLPGTHFHAGFGHLTGYSSAYYTYMWSLVIAKDLFSAFDGGDLWGGAVAQETALRYRDAVLAQGGSKDAADLVEDFLGRPYSTEAFAEWLAQDPLG